MKTLATTLFCAALAVPAFAASHEDVSAEAVAKIETTLADMKCQMDPDDIEMTEDGGYDLDDVICEGGQQYDIELDAEFKEVGRRAE
ncbi:Peptidase propeptide and YPEB domain-containing protein [Poseidonocella pacifica]|uniref:Peptidase propeptide and YPEB domain-containing protein n=1 Tax=Poseidonocella pacifica TaxID=871651 RepID=A0A1I0YDA8_9RHOB|nr:PepSY domain-containing protein [Poseidonocella pacifica]SFB11355.1 Peptidase propeptide and YPEB domain-containing protein [Poseidonocella pacifica]